MGKFCLKNDNNQPESLPKLKAELNLLESPLEKHELNDKLFTTSHSCTFHDSRENRKKSYPNTSDPRKQLFS